MDEGAANLEKTVLNWCKESTQGWVETSQLKCVIYPVCMEDRWFWISSYGEYDFQWDKLNYGLLWQNGTSQIWQVADFTSRLDITVEMCLCTLYVWETGDSESLHMGSMVFNRMSSIVTCSREMEQVRYDKRLILH